MAEKRYSEACERNKAPILEVLKNAFADCKRVLEIGSGTGQHAVFFAAELNHLCWQPTDTESWFNALSAGLGSPVPDNIMNAVELDVRMEPWPVNRFDGLYSANTLHYMSKECVEAFFRGAGRVLERGGQLIVYGPFNYGGVFTSSSNQRFDKFLRQEDPHRGIRDFEWVQELAAAERLEFIADHAMPANNRILHWCKATSV